MVELASRTETKTNIIKDLDCTQLLPQQIIFSQDQVGLIFSLIITLIGSLHLLIVL